MVTWRQKPDEKRRPLILEGARQTGKTWLARELGKREFKYYIEINFEEMQNLRNLFETDFDIQRILSTISAVTNTPIKPNETLIFFDEIQFARRGLLSLKYFLDKVPEYHIISAGSLLGVIHHREDSFPVGKVEFLRVYPLSFEEFLMATGNSGLVQILQSKDWEIIKMIHDKLVHLLKIYYFVGGMPEVVSSYVEDGSFANAREIQMRLLESYYDDFSKHPPQEILPRIQALWNSIPYQLAKENKKFIYNAVKQSARARDYETALQWLLDSGLIYKVSRISNAELPLMAFEDSNAFKLYMLDIGLLGAIVGLQSKTIVEGNEYFKQFKGALTEQFVLQSLKNISNTKIFYWTNQESTAEVDFVIQYQDRVIPIEVKAERNLKAKSLGVFIKKFGTTTNLRTSLFNYVNGEQITDLPLYALFELDNILG